MNFYFQPNSNNCKDLYVTEWSWKPIRSMLAIANFIEEQESGKILVMYSQLKKLDENMGEGISNPEICKKFAARLRQLICNPEEVENYGMTVEMENGKFIFTYPVALCTSAMQHKATNAIINYPGRDKLDQLSSMLKATEEEIMIVINFLENCNGFLMP